MFVLVEEEIINEKNDQNLNQNEGEDREKNEENMDDFEGKIDNEIPEDAGMDYLLFLILLLLLVGNQNSFNKYFDLFDQQTGKMKEVLDAFAATAEGLKSAVLAPQEMLDKQ
ncbi:MAG: hypothetical protein ACOCQS_02795, partial [Bacillota bacterium]